MNCYETLVTRALLGCVKVQWIDLGYRERDSCNLSIEHLKKGEYFKKCPQTARVLVVMATWI